MAFWIDFEMNKRRNVFFTKWDFKWKMKKSTIFSNIYVYWKRSGLKINGKDIFRFRELDYTANILKDMKKSLQRIV